MNDIEERLPISIIIFLVLWFGGIMFFVWQSWSPLGSPLIFVVSSMLLVMVWMGRFEWNPLAESSNVLSADGAISTLVKKPYKIGAGMYEAVVATKKEYVPDHIKQGYMSGFIGISAFLSGKHNMKIQGFSHDFAKIDESIEEGALIYRRKLDGTYPKQDIYGSEELKKELEERQYTVSKLATIVEKYKGIGASESQEQSEQIKDMMRAITSILKEVQQPNVQQQNQRGGNQND